MGLADPTIQELYLFRAGGVRVEYRSAEIRPKSNGRRQNTVVTAGF